MVVVKQIRVLTLTLDQDGTSVVYKLQKNCILQFRLGPSLLGHAVNLFTNYPQNNGDGKFHRNSYNVLPWQNDSNNKMDDTSTFANIDLKISGSFHFYLTKLK